MKAAELLTPAELQAYRSYHRNTKAGLNPTPRERDAQAAYTRKSRHAKRDEETSHHGNAHTKN